MTPQISQDKLIRFAWAVLVAYIIILVLLIVFKPDLVQTINSLIDALKYILISIVSYYFGSSESSKQKNELLTK